MKIDVKMFEPDSVAVVTGGSRGIGRAIVQALAAEGVKVFFTYLSNADKAKALLDELGNAGHCAEAHQLDVSDEDQVREYFRMIRKSGKRLDVLVNSAGIALDGLVATMSAGRFRKVIDVNVIGAFLCSREALRFMVECRAGSVVFISSALSHRGGRGQGNYCASKGALWSLTHALALEAAPYGVRVNSISPGFVDTDMTRRLPREAINAAVPLGRLATPEEIAQAVLLAASPRLSYLTGSDIVVDGGLLAS
ncbi:MAG TPA: 3-oxoacyl-ACP reductase family protein [Streptosporangiaceae bacterium]|nr:3-oxoacyl-ACP reductase family protein [Streptosporangiaceae bacterium]